MSQSSAKNLKVKANPTLSVHCPVHKAVYNLLNTWSSAQTYTPLASKWSSVVTGPHVVVKLGRYGSVDSQ